MQLRKIIAGLFLLVCANPIFSQVAQGIINYDVTIDIHRSLPADRQELKAMVPQFRTENYQLFFTPSESLYKAKESEEVVSQQGGMRMMMRTPKTETYHDRQSQERTVFQDIMGKNYLIVETLDILPWKFGNEQMEIAGYVCMMAWYTDTLTKQEITAWFSPLLPAFMGPDRFATLPGTVLAVDINNGERVYVARSIEQREIKAAEIRKPNRGERISRQDFDKMIDEQMQRMNPGGGARIRF